MPCYDDRDRGGTVYVADPKQQEHIDRLTSMLCQVCRNAESYPGFKLPSNVQTWWENHKKVDARRAKQAKDDAAYAEKIRKWQAQKPKR